MQVHKCFQLSPPKQWCMVLPKNCIQELLHKQMNLSKMLQVKDILGPENYWMATTTKACHCDTPICYQFSNSALLYVTVWKEV